MMRNIPEFHVLDMAAVICGATPISIYNSSSPEQVAYLVGHCEAKVGVVEDVGFLERFLKVRDELADLKRDRRSLRPGRRRQRDGLRRRRVLEHDPADLDAAAAAR